MHHRCIVSYKAQFSSKHKKKQKKKVFFIKKFRKKRCQFRLKKTDKQCGDPTVKKPDDIFPGYLEKNPFSQLMTKIMVTYFSSKISNRMDAVS